MSNAGQGVLSVVGAVVGFYIGGPQGAIYGFQLGLAAGTLLFPTQLPGIQGPRLGDAGQTLSQVGAPIPWVHGAQVVGGIITWASPIRETATTSDLGGKGAPEQEQTTYSYSRSWAVLLTDGEIAGVRRVWFNGKLKLDRTPQGDDESYADFQSRLALNELFMEKVTIYLGTEDQMPDPVIESFEGAGNVPAYRGYSYMVFDDVELLPEDGNRIPAQMKFEVYTAGAATPQDTSKYSTKLLFPWIRSSNPRFPPLNPYNIHTFTSALGGALTPGAPGTAYDTPPGGPWSTLNPVIQAKEDQVGKEFRFYHGHDLNGVAGNPGPGEAPGYTNMMGAPEAYQTEALTVGIHLNHFDVDAYQVETTLLSNIDSALAAVGVTSGSNLAGMVNDIEGAYSGVASVVYRPPTSEDIRDRGWDLMTTDGAFNRFSTINVRITVERVPRAPWDPCEDPRSVLIPGLDNYVILNGELQKCGPWTEMTGTAKALAEYTVAGDEVSQYPLNPTLPLGHVKYDDQPFWEDAYNRAVARGQMPAGLTYGVHYPKVQSFWYERASSSDTVDLNPIPISDVVAAVCDRVGARVEFLYDVSDLQTRYIIGYKNTNPTAARAIIDPLRSVGFFDCVEDSIQLKFPTRGKAPVDTFVYDEIGAFFINDGRVPLTESKKALEFELPRQVRIHYQCPDRDYDPGEEASPARFDTRAETVIDAQVPVAITPDQAAQSAEVMHRDMWAARYEYATSVDISKAGIQAGDCVILPVDGALERVRLVSVGDVLPNLRQLSFVRDDDGNYVSTATGSQTFPVPPKLTYYGPVETVLLDLPVLDVTNETPDSGFYVAAAPLITGGAFRGATLSKSTDGVSFTPVASAATATTMGFLEANVDAGPTTVFDWDNEIIVTLQYGSLESRDEIDVLGGANAAAIGADGRWEIVQFLNAESIYENTWRLTGLLRGRRGTEYMVGTAFEADRFVLLSAATLAKASLSSEAVNIPVSYRASAIGAPLSSGNVFEFTGHGAQLRPFSPVHITAERSGNDWSLAWYRRDRLATDIDIPMSEAQEDYEVDILKADGTVARTISVLTKSATYSEDQQIVDFGSAQSTLRVNVYQISDAVGRSYPGEAEFTA